MLCGRGSIIIIVDLKVDDVIYEQRLKYDDEPSDHASHILQEDWGRDIYEIRKVALEPSHP